MSIWNKPLFGTKLPPRTPAGPMGVRRSRIRSGGALDLFPVWVLGLLTGEVLFAAEMMVALSFGMSSPAIGPRIAFEDLLKRIHPVTTATMVMLAVAVAFVGPPLGRWWFDRTTHTVTREGLASGRSARLDSRYFVLAYLVIPLVGIGIMALFVSWAGSCFVSAQYTAPAGGVFVGLGLFGRKGARLACAKCSYPMGSWRSAVDLCPECGRDWRAPWGARYGARAVRWRLVGIGAALLAASATLTLIAARAVRFP